MASYMYKVLGTPTGTTKNTISVWFKRSKLTSSQGLVFANGNAGGLTLNSDDKLQSYNAGGALKPNRLFRDTSAWYHVVLTTDTTLGTADDRLKMYINGVQETSFATRTNPSVNATSNLGTATEHIIGANNDPANYYDGLMSHVQMVDGLALAPTEFGQYDANGVWTIKTSSYGTLGNNGFHITFDNPADIGASTNSNNFTPNANLKPTQDNPSNVFATWNPNLAMNSTMTIANGNTTGTTGSNYASGASNCWFSTIGVSSGKWYAEFKESAGTNDQGQQIGVGYDLSKFQQGSTASAYNVGFIAEGWGYLGSEGNVKNNNSTVLSGLSTWTIGDIVCVALDMDNHKLYFRKNGGSWENSGNPESGSTGTGALSLTTGETYFFGCSDASLANTYTFQANFGNGYFGTTAVASAGTNASGNGIFEYDVPTGFTALSTKGLNL